MEYSCPLCGQRISNWSLASIADKPLEHRRLRVIEGCVVHALCLADFWLRHGQNWELLRKKIRGEL